MTDSKSPLIVAFESAANIAGKYTNLYCVNFRPGDVRKQRGSYSLVFRAKNVATDQPVAIKIMDPDHLSDLYRMDCFEREPRILTRLQNHHRCLRLSKQALKNPYVTATFGLYYLKKDNISRGKAFYEQAIQLTDDKRLKARIRQRMSLELAKRFGFHKQDADALYWVDRSIKEQLGFEFVRTEALELKRSLIQRKLH